MPVSPSDPAYGAEVVPQSLVHLGTLLCAAYGVGPSAYGTRGNLAHTNGYHRSRRYNLAHDPGNYSVQLAADKQGDQNWVCAFDITPSVWGTPDNRQKMITITKRMRAAARAHDPRVSALREFAGTEDGVHVVTIDMQTGADRTPFDSSHLDHGHGSLFRGRAADDHTPIFQVLTGVDDMGLTSDEKAKIVEGWLTPDNAMFAWLRGIANGTMPAQGPNGLDWNNMVPAGFPGLVQLGTAISASAAREQALLAAIQALAAGGTSVDTAAVIAAVDGVLDRVDALEAMLNASQVEAAGLRQKLADALAPAAE